MEQIESFSIGLKLDSAGLKRDLGDLSRLGNSFGASITRAFTGAISGGRKFSDVLRTLALSLSRQALSAALRPIGNLAGNALTGLFGAFTGNSHGNVIRNRQVTPFADGGVVNSPVLFPLRSALGVAGEAGPEAILPLKRGGDGRLGVAAGGAGGVVVNMTITTPDVGGFRRSQAQVAASLARAIERGQRNL